MVASPSEECSAWTWKSPAYQPGVRRGPASRRRRAGAYGSASHSGSVERSISTRHATLPSASPSRLRGDRRDAQLDRPLARRDRARAEAARRASLAVELGVREVLRPRSRSRCATPSRPGGSSRPSRGTRAPPTARRAPGAPRQSPRSSTCLMLRVRGCLGLVVAVAHAHGRRAGRARRTAASRSAPSSEVSNSPVITRWGCSEASAAPAQMPAPRRAPPPDDGRRPAAPTARRTRPRARMLEPLAVPLPPLSAILVPGTDRRVWTSRLRCG